MLKKYIDFIKESKEDYDVPSHFVELNSIGYYLDPIEGKIYAMLKNGGYELEPYNVEDDIENLSDDERRLVDSFYISTEKLIKDRLNLDLIHDIVDRCISEELIDDGVGIYTAALVRDHNYHTSRSILTYSLTYNNIKSNNNDLKYNWKKVFKRDADIVKSAKNEDIYYVCFFYYENQYDDKFKPKINFIENIIKEDYPDIEFSFSTMLQHNRS